MRQWCPPSEFERGASNRNIRPLHRKINIDPKPPSKSPTPKSPSCRFKTGPDEKKPIKIPPSFSLCHEDMIFFWFQSLRRPKSPARRPPSSFFLKMEPP